MEGQRWIRLWVWLKGEDRKLVWDDKGGRRRGGERAVWVCFIRGKFWGKVARQRWCYSVLGESLVWSGFEGVSNRVCLSIWYWIVGKYFDLFIVWDVGVLQCAWYLFWVLANKREVIVSFVFIIWFLGDVYGWECWKDIFLFWRRGMRISCVQDRQSNWMSWVC